MHDRAEHARVLQRFRAAHNREGRGEKRLGVALLIVGSAARHDKLNASRQIIERAVWEPIVVCVEVVTDGAAVLERHREAPADLILMDLQMPGMGGIAAMRRLRALGGAAGAVPVVALTAYARSADRQLALDAGMDAYLAKPIVVAEFYDLLRRLLPEDESGNG